MKLHFQRETYVLKFEVDSATLERVSQFLNAQLLVWLVWLVAKLLNVI